MPVDGISAAEFATAFARCAPFEHNPVIAVAVSGGADSMALLRLLVAWAAEHDVTIVALTVDHGLRPEAAGEARQVAAWAASLGIEHDILTWQPAGASTQDEARQARYRLLQQACARRGILHLVCGHHQKDQGETFLLRLAKGSGLDGLAGMRMITALPQVRLLRPLLDFPAERLPATCLAHGQAWCEDGSNLSPNYARGRLRAIEKSLVNEGLGPETLSITARRLQLSADFIQHEVAGLLARVATVYPQGYAILALGMWRQAHEELRRRSLAGLIRTIGNEPYLPPGRQMEDILASLDRGDVSRATLGNCLLTPQGDSLLIEREARHIEAAKALPAGWNQWDRFAIFSAAPAFVRPAEPADRALLASPVRAMLAATQPAILSGSEVVALPTLGYYAPAWAPPRVFCRFDPQQPLTNSAFNSSLPVV